VLARALPQRSRGIFHAAQPTGKARPLTRDHAGSRGPVAGGYGVSGEECEYPPGFPLRLAKIEVGDSAGPRESGNRRLMSERGAFRGPMRMPATRGPTAKEKPLRI